MIRILACQPCFCILSQATGRLSMAALWTQMSQQHCAGPEGMSTSPAQAQSPKHLGSLPCIRSCILTVAWLITDRLQMAVIQMIVWRQTGLGCACPFHSDRGPPAGSLRQSLILLSFMHLWQCSFSEPLQRSPLSQKPCAEARLNCIT